MVEHPYIDSTYTEQIKIEDNMSDLWQLPPALACQYCGLPLFYNDEEIIRTFRDYFYGKFPSCPACGKALDWWLTVLYTIKGRSRHTDPLMVVGARRTAFMVELLPHQPFIIRFVDYGISENARILRVKYYVDPNNDGGLIPLEMHGETPFRYVIPTEITLYPAARMEKNVGPTRIIVDALWVPHTADDEAWRQLVASFEAYGRQNFTECIVPANVSVESTLTLIIGSFLERIASKENIKDFLGNAATYSYQINIVLPALLSFTKAPKLPDHVRGFLNRLRGYRNDIAHHGAVQKVFDSDAVAESVCAALFGFHYLQIIRPILLNPSCDLSNLRDSKI